MALLQGPGDRPASQPSLPPLLLPPLLLLLLPLCLLAAKVRMPPQGSGGLVLRGMYSSATSVLFATTAARKAQGWWLRGLLLQVLMNTPEVWPAAAAVAAAGGKGPATQAGERAQAVNNIRRDDVGRPTKASSQALRTAEGCKAQDTSSCCPLSTLSLPSTPSSMHSTHLTSCHTPAS